jgi:hypothetical protein
MGFNFHPSVITIKLKILILFLTHVLLQTIFTNIRVMNGIKVCTFKHTICHHKIHPKT